MQLPQLLAKKLVLLPIFLWLFQISQAQNPDTIVVKSGQLALKGLLWHPPGEGPFPAINFCHGNYETTDTIYDVVQHISTLGSIFSRHGYIFFGLFRRGVGLSKAEGINSADLMSTALKEKGIVEREKIKLQLLQTDHLQDMTSALTTLRKRNDVDSTRIGVVGHSFGGSLALLLAETDPRLKAVVTFGAAGFSWDQSPELRNRSFSAIKNIHAPIMLIHAQNDYSVNPGYALDSLMNKLGKPHLLRIYPPFGKSQREGHNFIFLNTKSWEIDVFRYLDDIFKAHPKQLPKQRNINKGYAAVNNTTLYYEIAGEGKPLILIHGSFGDRRFWDLQFTELSKKYKVLRYDIRGYGKSALPDSNEIYRDVDDLKALMDFLKIEKAHICGLSLGSFIAFDMAFAYPDRCLSLIPVGPRVAGDGTDEYKTPNADSVRTIIATTTNIVRLKGAKEATDYLWTGNHAMGRAIISPKTKEAMLRMGYEYSWWRYRHLSKREYAFPAAIKHLNEIKIPTLIITAEHDLALSQEVAAILAKGIPGAKLISIRGAGHMMNMDKPKDFNKAVSDFIDKHKQ